MDSPKNWISDELKQIGMSSNRINKLEHAETGFPSVDRVTKTQSYELYHCCFCILVLDIKLVVLKISSRLMGFYPMSKINLYRLSFGIIIE